MLNTINKLTPSVELNALIHGGNILSFESLRSVSSLVEEI